MRVVEGGWKESWIANACAKEKEREYNAKGGWRRKRVSGPKRGWGREYWLTCYTESGGGRERGAETRRILNILLHSFSFPFKLACLYARFILERPLNNILIQTRTFLKEKIKKKSGTKIREGLLYLKTSLFLWLYTYIYIQPTRLAVGFLISLSESNWNG